MLTSREPNTWQVSRRGQSRQAQATRRSLVYLALSHTRARTRTHTHTLSATIQGPQNIILGGKTIIQPHSILRGDLRRSGAGGKASVVIALGRYCNIGEGVVVRPPGKCYRG